MDEQDEWMRVKEQRGLVPTAHGGNMLLAQTTLPRRPHIMRTRRELIHWCSELFGFEQAGAGGGALTTQYRGAFSHKERTHPALHYQCRGRRHLRAGRVRRRDASDEGRDGGR